MNSFGSAAPMHGVSIQRACTCTVGWRSESGCYGFLWKEIGSWDAFDMVEPTRKTEQEERANAMAH